VTAALKAAGVPLNVIADEGYKTLDAVSGAKRSALFKADLVDDEAKAICIPIGWCAQNSIGRKPSRRTPPPSSNIHTSR